MRPSEPTVNPEQEPSADLQWLNAKMPTCLGWPFWFVEFQAQKCVIEKQICPIIDYAPDQSIQSYITWSQILRQ